MQDEQEGLEEEGGDEQERKEEVSDKTPLVDLDDDEGETEDTSSEYLMSSRNEEEASIIERLGLEEEEDTPDNSSEIFNDCRLEMIVVGEEDDAVVAEFCVFTVALDSS